MPKKQKHKPSEHPDDVGERWRQDMGPLKETLPSVVWHRVWAMFRIDLSDPKQASGLQIYRLLHELMADQQGDVIDVEAIDLEACVDSRVLALFPKKGPPQ